MNLRHHHPVLTAFIVVLAVLVLVVASSWISLDPLVAWGLSKGLGRPVRIDRFAVGDLLTGHPVLVFEGLSIGNPPGFPGDKPLGTIRRLRLRVAARPLIASAGRDIVVSEITVEDPQGDLRAAPDGSRNWAFSSSSGGSARSVRIGTLTITDGTFRINDPKLKADLVLKLHTQSPCNGGEPNLLVHSQGIYAGQPFTGDFTGGSILSLRDPAKPYPVSSSRVKTSHTSIRSSACHWWKRHPLPCAAISTTAVTTSSLAISPGPSGTAILKAISMSIAATGAP
jgi:AsmA family protein